MYGFQMFSLLTLNVRAIFCSMDTLRCVEMLHYSFKTFVKGIHFLKKDCIRIVSLTQPRLCLLFRTITVFFLVLMWRLCNIQEDFRWIHLSLIQLHFRNRFKFVYLSVQLVCPSVQLVFSCLTNGSQFSRYFDEILYSGEQYCKWFETNHSTYKVLFCLIVD